MGRNLNNLIASRRTIVQDGVSRLDTLECMHAFMMKELMCYI